MKLKSTLITLIAVFAFASTAMAENFADALNLSNDMSSSSRKFGAIVGVDIDYSYDRNLKSMRDDTELTFYGAKVGAVIMNKGLVYLLAGQASAKTEFSDNGAAVETETENGFYWGFGGSVALAEMKFDTGDRLIFGVDGWYRSADLDNDKAKIGGASIDPSSDEWRYSEYQIGLGVSYKLEFFVPYVGFKYADVSGDHSIRDDSGTTYSVDLDEEAFIGFFGGFSFSFGDIGLVSFETRLGDEVSFGANALIRF